MGVESHVKHKKQPSTHSTPTPCGSDLQRTGVKILRCSFTQSRSRKEVMFKREMELHSQKDMVNSILKYENK